MTDDPFEPTAEAVEAGAQHLCHVQGGIWDNLSAFDKQARRIEARAVWMMMQSKARRLPVPENVRKAYRADLVASLTAKQPLKAGLSYRREGIRVTVRVYAETYGADPEAAVTELEE